MGCTFEGLDRQGASKAQLTQQALCLVSVKYRLGPAKVEVAVF